VRALVASVVAVVASLGLAAPALAAPTNAPSALVFDPTTCRGLQGQATLGLIFTVNGGGMGVAHTSDGRIFQPLALFVTVNGEVVQVVNKNNAGKAEYTCTGDATVEGPDGPAEITFIASGVFKG
jgi:hypothetical protein